MRILILTMLAGLSVSPVLSTAQDETGGQKLTPREMFLAARDAAKAKPPAKPRPASASPSARVVKPSSSETATVAGNESKSIAAADIIRTSYSSLPLGLRYTLSKKVSGELVDVSPDAVFHSGDHIQVGVEVTEPGYLYIVSQGTSGTWEVLFPSSKIGSGDNLVQAGHRYFVPSGSTYFGFSGEPGTEKLFLIFARQPEQEMDSLIYSLQGNKPTPASDSPSKEPEHPPLVVKASPIDNGVVDLLRTTYSRDLIIEKLDEEQPGQKPDKSVYVVNPKDGPDTRVVADVRLVHE